MQPLHCDHLQPGEVRAARTIGFQLSGWKSVIDRHRLVFGTNLPLGVSMQMLCSTGVCCDQILVLAQLHGPCAEKAVLVPVCRRAYRGLEWILLWERDLAVIDPTLII